MTTDLDPVDFDREDPDACAAHRGDGFREDCNSCKLERKARVLADAWEAGEPIPRVANSRALDMLEWRIIRRALVMKENPTLQMLAVIASRLAELERTSDNVGEIASAIDALEERADE